MIIGDNMASAIIHLCVAKCANEILKRNEKEFLLGSIAPDISKQVPPKFSIYSFVFTSLPILILSKLAIKYTG